MNITIRIPRIMFDKVRTDLGRSHKFAFERVGFLFGPSVHLGNDWVVLLNNYLPVQDIDYICDKYVGAKINANALRTAMQHSMDHNLSVFHVHEHGGLGIPWFSGIDTDSMAEIIPPFTVVCPNQVHGGIVLSQTNASALSWIFDVQNPINTDISIVGFPTAINKSSLRRMHYE